MKSIARFVVFNIDLTIPDLRLRYVTVRYITVLDVGVRRLTRSLSIIIDHGIYRVPYKRNP